MYCPHLLLGTLQISTVIKHCHLDYQFMHVLEISMHSSRMLLFKHILLLSTVCL